MRIFALAVSLIALYVFHRFAKRHTNLLLANLGVVLLSLQPLFLAQASLILPEILLFTLFMLAFDSFLSKSYVMYALYGSLIMLTKETGAVFIMVFGLVYLIENYRTWKGKIFWRNLLMLAVPVLVYIGFLLLHYHAFGTFFFTEHLDYITINLSTVHYKFDSSTWMLFLAQGRNVIFFVSILALMILLFGKKKIQYQRFLVLSLSIIVVFMIFSILNFFVYRYVFPVMGISLLASLVLIQQIKTRYQVLNVAYVLCIISVSAYYSTTKRGQSDADLGYIQYLVVHQEMVKYCEQQNFYEKDISGGYNMVMSLRDRFAHYLSTDKNFKTHHLPGIEHRDIVIYDSTCWPVEMPQNEKNKLTLIKRFEYKKHWGEIYSTPVNEITQLK
jgi:4-amino-4-deoxy-L-arabinose transferase-like glycosyltransferase